MAAYLTLPGRLADAAVALGATEKKMEEGKDLIRYFSVPCKPTKTNGGRTRNLPADAPEKWAVYKQYNAQDVETERAIRKALEKYPLPEQEWELYALDQQINDRGVRVDKRLVKNAIAVDAVFAQAAYQRAKELTGLENPGSVNQLKAWLADQDMPMESLARKIVQEKAAQTDGIVAELLNLRLELSKTSVKKYEAMARCVCRDGRVHGLLQFYGANRTGRWAGRLVQVQKPPSESSARSGSGAGDCENRRRGTAGCALCLRSRYAFGADPHGVHSEGWMPFSRGGLFRHRGARAGMAGERRMGTGGIPRQGQDL